MNQQHSSLFILALWEGDYFKVLDEILLPWRVEYITVRNVSEALQAVKEMKTRAFGQVLTFLYTAALVTKENHSEDLESLRRRLAQLATEFTQARPTFDFKGLGRLLDDWLAQIPNGAHPGRWLEDKIHKYVAAVPKVREARARRAAELLPNACRLLTHCNVSGEVVRPARTDSRKVSTCRRSCSISVCDRRTAGSGIGWGSVKSLNIFLAYRRPINPPTTTSKRMTRPPRHP